MTLATANPGYYCIHCRRNHRLSNRDGGAPPETICPTCGQRLIYIPVQPGIGLREAEI